MFKSRERRDNWKLGALTGSLFFVKSMTISRIYTRERGQLGDD